MYYIGRNILIGIFVLALMFFASVEIFMLSYVSFFIHTVLRTVLMKADTHIKAYLIISYVMILILQLAMAEIMVFGYEGSSYPFVRRFFAVSMFLLPFFIGRYIVTGRNAQFYMPSVDSMLTVISMSQLKKLAIGTSNVGHKLSISNIAEVIKDMPRHDSFRYINNGSLTQEYFDKARESLSDPNLYLVISNTGSAASDIISVFTGKQYNHASLSFDADLQTIISYNGGERMYPPGLNEEMLEYFAKTPSSKILVYSLACPVENKERLIEKIADINKEGSAYNMLGLVIKKSHKPNIMFCSQFVYKMLDFAGVGYFTKSDGYVSPTDLIEQDYYKRLRFEKEIVL